jgi:hypothetical protein
MQQTRALLDISKPHSPGNGCADVKCEKPNHDGLLGGCAVAKGGSGEKTQVRTARPKSGVPAMASTNVDEPGLSRSRDDFGAIPVPKHRCDHCGSATGITYPYDWPGRPDGIRLHQRCEADWFDSAGAQLVCDSPVIDAAKQPDAVTDVADVPDPVPRQPAPAMEGCKEDVGLPPQVIAKQPDAVPEKAPSAPPAMTYDEQIEAIMRRQMLPGDRKRALQLVRNAEALARDNAAMKGRLH